MGQINEKTILGKYQSNIKYAGQNQFDCGNKILNNYVRNSLKKNVNCNYCHAIVLTKDHDKELIGICSYAPYSLKKDKASKIDALSGSLPESIPVVRIIMLAVKTKYQRKGYGKDLLGAFFKELKNAYNFVPIKGIYIDADIHAIKFYESLGFNKIEEQMFETVPMFLHIESIFTTE